jgi:hypothetical protein
MLAATPSAPLIVVVNGPPCTIELNGLPIASDSLRDAITKLKGRRRGVIVRYRLNAPYRCIGGAIFNIQRAKVRRITLDPPFAQTPAR